ncbi:MAG: ATP--guanido phosphotransferase [Candidatus Omnitrophica bacterium]|nr:ATP--guanido phosphotransferase [Candidatus Omnitrophota bacterium]MCM8828804.1 ATP--guanido phosphotransferase [Candidatus Omnitrophota bacterium]
MDDKLKNLILNEPALSNGLIDFSVRLRLARNISKYPFPHQLDEKQAENIVMEVIKALDRVFDCTYFVIKMRDTNRLMRELMVERHIISPEFAEDGFGKTLIWFVESGMRILVNEEDHLRISCYGEVRNVRKLWEDIDIFDTNLAKELKFAFDKEFGYLTSCPTNLGPGLRISSIMFLPSLKATRKINNIFELIYRLGCVIRGFYGEGSSNFANFYQISSGSVLGKTEKEVCENFETIISVIRQQEINAIAGVNVSTVKRNIKIFMDRIASCASGITLNQAINGISLLLFGKKLGIIQVEENILKRLIYKIMPASLSLEAKRRLEPEEQDAIRLQMLGNILRGVYV